MVSFVLLRANSLRIHDSRKHWFTVLAASFALSFFAPSGYALGKATSAPVVAVPIGHNHATYNWWRRLTVSEKSVAVQGMIGALQYGYQGGILMDLFAVVSQNKKQSPQNFKSPPLEFSKNPAYYAEAIDAFYARHTNDELALKMVGAPEILACASDTPFPNKEVCRDLDTLFKRLPPR